MNRREHFIDLIAAKVDELKKLCIELEEHLTKKEELGNRLAQAVVAAACKTGGLPASPELCVGPSITAHPLRWRGVSEATLHDFGAGTYFQNARKNPYSIITNGRFSEEAILNSPNEFFTKRVFRAINQAIVEKNEPSEIS